MICISRIIKHLHSDITQPPFACSFFYEKYVESCINKNVPPASKQAFARAMSVQFPKGSLQCRVGKSNLKCYKHIGQTDLSKSTLMNNSNFEVPNGYLEIEKDIPQYLEILKSTYLTINESFCLNIWVVFKNSTWRLIFANTDVDMVPLGFDMSFDWTKERFGEIIRLVNLLKICMGKQRGLPN